MTEETRDDKPEPTRPNSQWATGRRRELKNPPRPPAGFVNGARVRRRS